MAKELVMYSRRGFCPFVSIASRVLNKHNVIFREVLIDKDDEARERVLNWTGFLSVPTFVVANTGETLPFEEPAALAPGSSPRGVDRGTMITEPSANQLTTWLEQRGFLSHEVKA